MACRRLPLERIKYTYAMHTTATMRDVLHSVRLNLSSKSIVCYYVQWARILLRVSALGECHLSAYICTHNLLLLFIYVYYCRGAVEARTQR